MSFTSGIVRPELQQATTPTVYNVTAVLANTEYTQALSSDVKSFTIRCRGNSELKLAFSVGQSGVTYLTVPKGTNYSQDNLSFVGSLYFQTSKPNEIIEILEWI